MSLAEVNRFAADFETDPKLQAALKGKVTDVESLVEIAQSRGYDLTVDDVRAHIRAQKHELTEQELDAAVGGLYGMMGMMGLGGGFIKT